jgi:hypothetical protein
MKKVIIKTILTLGTLSALILPHLAIWKVLFTTFALLIFWIHYELENAPDYPEEY